MKTIAFFFLQSLLFSPIILLKAQTYHPMAVEGAHWVIGSDQFVTPWLDNKFTLSIRGDTTVNEKVYKKVYKDFFEFDAEKKIFYNNITGSALYALMRDDTLQRKVYAITGPTFYDNCPKDEEYLLFDFSVEKGDTLHWCSLTGLRFDPDSIQRVDSTQVAYSYLTGEDRNTLYTFFGVAAYLDGSVVEQPVSIIEGFGYENYGPFIEGTTLLDYCIGTNSECGFITDTENKEYADLKIYPNPAHDFIYVVPAQTGSGQFRYQLFSMQGKKMKEGLLRENRILVKDFQAGIYFLMLYSTKRALKQKMIIR